MEQLLLLTSEAANQDCIQEAAISEVDFKLIQN
jgi:hypothetical protein